MILDGATHFRIVGGKSSNPVEAKSLGSVIAQIRQAEKTGRVELLDQMAIVPLRRMVTGGRFSVDQSP